MPLVESTCCMNCHKLLQRIVVLETKLFAGLPKQTEHTADGHHGPPQHTAGESCESSESKQFIPSVEEQAETDRRTNRWHKRSETQRLSRHQIVTSISYCCCSILYPRYGYDKTCTHWYSTTPYTSWEQIWNIDECGWGIPKYDKTRIESASS